MWGLIWVKTVCKCYRQMTDDMSDILMQKVKYNGFDPELSEPKELPKEF